MYVALAKSESSADRQWASQTYHATSEARFGKAVRDARTRPCRAAIARGDRAGASGEGTGEWAKRERMKGARLLCLWRYCSCGGRDGRSVTPRTRWFRLAMRRTSRQTLEGTNGAGGRAVNGRVRVFICHAVPTSQPTESRGRKPPSLPVGKFRTQFFIRLISFAPSNIPTFRTSWRPCSPD